MSAPDSTTSYCSAGFESSSGVDLSCEKCDGCSSNVSFRVQLGGMTKQDMDAHREFEYVVFVAWGLSVAPDDFRIISVTENTTSNTRRHQSASSERERLGPSVTVTTEEVASTEKNNSMVLTLTEGRLSHEYRRTTLLSVSSPVVSNSITMIETQSGNVDGETVTETTPTNDTNSMFVYVIGGVSIASGVYVVASCVLVCMRTKTKNHAGSPALYLKDRTTDVKFTPYVNNMYVRIDEPPFTKGTYYARQ